MPPKLSIRRLLDRFYSSPGSSKNNYTIPLLGLDASGKTTLLNRLKTAELVETNPSMGLDLVTVNVRLPGITEEPLKMTSWDGGCGKRLPIAFLANYTQTAGSDALIWLVDSSDGERLAESVDELRRAIALVSYPHVNAREIPVLILATKQDASGAMTVKDVQNAVASVTSGLGIFVVGTTLNQSVTEGALAEAFRWLIESIENARAGKPPPCSPTDDPPSPTALEIKLDSWLQRAESDSPVGRFLRQFETINLPAWDHYTRIRVIYSMLTTSSRQKGRDMILQGIEKYSVLSEQPFHVTMTYFWIQVVHFSICGMPPVAEVGSDSESLSDKSEGCDTGFVRFLLLSPFVADEDLWTEYYSRDVMMSPKARARMVLPNRRRLPNLVGREVISS
ncbi:ADP-ribosylation factor, partial [Mycena vulgaris]